MAQATKVFYFMNVVIALLVIGCEVAAGMALLGANNGAFIAITVLVVLLGLVANALNLSLYLIRKNPELK